MLRPGMSARASSPGRADLSCGTMSRYESLVPSVRLSEWSGDWQLCVNPDDRGLVAVADLSTSTPEAGVVEVCVRPLDDACPRSAEWAADVIADRFFAMPAYSTHRVVRVRVDGLPGHVDREQELPPPAAALPVVTDPRVLPAWPGSAEGLPPPERRGLPELAERSVSELVALLDDADEDRRVAAAYRLAGSPFVEVRDATDRFRPQTEEGADAARSARTRAGYRASRRIAAVPPGLLYEAGAPEGLVAFRSATHRVPLAWVRRRSFGGSNGTELGFVAYLHAAEGGYVVVLEQFEVHRGAKRTLGREGFRVLDDGARTERLDPVPALGLRDAVDHLDGRAAG